MVKGFAPTGYVSRLLALIVTLLAESLIVGNLPHPWFQPQQIMAAPIAFAAALLFFGRRKLKASPLEDAPLNRLFLAWHVIALAAMIASTLVLLHRIPPGTTAALTLFSADFWLVALWYSTLAALAITLALALFPLRQLSRTLGGLRFVWLYAALTTVATMSARTLVRVIWDAPNSSFGRALQESTFAGTRTLLDLFYPNVIAVPATHELGTSKFIVEVAGTCSGIEGLALMLVFTVGWIIFARRELILARSILLVPVALALSWTLNLVRIALLIMIGSAGHPETAVNGFHSEAGWIMFNAIAIGFLLAVQHIQWLHRPTPRNAPRNVVILSEVSRSCDTQSKDLLTARSTTTADSLSNNRAGTTDATSAYLLPFLAVLATSLLTHAASSGFDWLYPLRLVVAAAVLWYFRADYRSLDWRFGWLGPTTGTIVFLLWIAAAHFQHFATVSPLGDSLAHLTPPERAFWLTARVLAAVITVPLAEELAFRGYLARRIVSSDFETVPFARLGWLAIAISSVAFGLLHGGLWQVGIIAGIAFALAAKRTNRLGEAVAAHATANLLLAVWVLTRGDYGLW